MAVVRRKKSVLSERCFGLGKVLNSDGAAEKM